MKGKKRAKGKEVRKDKEKKKEKSTTFLRHFAYFQSILTIQN